MDLLITTLHVIPDKEKEVFFLKKTFMLKTSHIAQIKNSVQLINFWTGQSKNLSFMTRKIFIYFKGGDWIHKGDKTNSVFKMKIEPCQSLCLLCDKKLFWFLIQNTIQLNNFALRYTELNTMPFLCQNEHI